MEKYLISTLNAQGQLSELANWRDSLFASATYIDRKRGNVGYNASMYKASAIEILQKALDGYFIYICCKEKEKIDYEVKLCDLSDLFDEEEIKECQRWLKEEGLEEEEEVEIFFE